uniref:Laminin EGF-like domain-containing protein n=1 Tax=Callorhinchus milii TaxID=7868 RepID=A0A4W3K4A5_CALMI
MQCRDNGTCVCKQGFGGYKCDQCHTNYFYNSTTFHCQQCPVCYGLVRDQVDRLKEKLHNLEEGLEKSTCRSDHWRQYYSIHLETAVRDMVVEVQSLQDTKEIFLSDIRGVESSLEEIGEKLSNVSQSLSCEESQFQCRLVSNSHLLILTTHAQLQAARETLNQTVSWRIPIGTESDTNNRISGVQEARTLAASHGEVAEKIQLLVGEALSMSNKSYTLLTDILGDRSSEGHITEVEDKIEAVQSAKEELERELEDALKEAKKLYTSTQLTLPNVTVQLPNITDLEPEVGSRGLEAEIAIVENLLQSKERLVNEVIEEVQTQAEELGKQMAARQSYAQLLKRTNSARATGMASVQAGRRVRKEANTLLKHLDDNKKRFSARRAKTRGAVKKMRSIREKVLADAKKKTAQAARVLRAARTNAATGNATSHQTLHLSSRVSREAQRIKRKAEDCVSSSSVLRSDLEMAQAEVEVWEKQVGALKLAAVKDLETAAEVNAGVQTMGKNIKKAKHSLGRDVKKLTELLKTIEGLELNPATDEVLNETETRVSLLSSQINSRLTQKVRTLEAAAEMQILRMKAFEKDIAEIVAEKHSLEDIARTLPRGCFNSPGATRQ